MIQPADRVSQSALAGRIVRWRSSCRNRGRRKESPIHIRNLNNNKWAEVESVGSTGPDSEDLEGGRRALTQSRQPNSVQRAPHRKSTAGTKEEFDEKVIAAQSDGCEKERWAASATGESKPGQPSAVAPTVRPDTTSTRMTDGDRSLKRKGYQAPADGEETRGGRGACRRTWGRSRIIEFTSASIRDERRWRAWRERTRCGRRERIGLENHRLCLCQITSQLIGCLQFFQICCVWQCWTSTGYSPSLIATATKSHRL